MTSLGARDRRALLAGGAILVPALLWALVIRPYAAALGEVRDRTERERGLLARELGLVQQARHYPGLVDRARGRVDEEAPRLFGGVDGLAAASALEGYLAEKAGPARVLLDRSESRSTEGVADGLVALQADVQGTGDLQGILTFLRSIETGPKLVRVERLVMERRGAPSAGGEEALSFSATIVGYTLSDSASVDGASGGRYATPLPSARGRDADGSGSAGPASTTGSAAPAATAESPDGASDAPGLGNSPNGGAGR